MKTRIFVLGLFVSLALSLSARIFDAGEHFYINMEAKSVKDEGGDLKYGWYSDGNNFNRAYFFKGSTGAWSSLVKQYEGTVWYVEAPAGDWDHVVLTRHSSAEARWDNIKHQTGDIKLFYYDGSELKIRQQNYIQNFYYDDTPGSGKKDGANWEYVAPAPVGDPSSWVYEDEQICTDAAGTKYILQAKNYDYENTYAHSWFKYESGTWTRLDQSEWYTVEDRNHIALPVTLGAAYSDVYYFIQCARPTMCRLVRVRLNQDCSEGAPGACKIISFAAVASEANVTDKKAAVNGVVAFDDKKNAGQLQIWCPGIDTVTIANADIETPQTFKLEGFDASSAKTYTLYAKFLSGSGCDGSCTVSVNPPSATPTVHTTTGTAADLRLTRFTAEDVTLTPNEQSSTYFMWTNTADKDTVTTGARNHTFTAPTEEKTITYYFLATNDPEAPEGNLISNGTFEKPVIRDDSLESMYAFWGRDNIEYYTTHPDVSGGYAITDNANTFWHEFQTVKAHEGTYFGLFDSKIYDGTDQAAWIARSGSKNPKLKVISGVSYLFSFWVANINAYYQMNNGARLQFQISYDGDAGPWHDLGDSINLSNFKDSRWHGMSSLVTPTVSSTNVVLRVINNNKSSKNIGNDFALDDIRFEAITPNSSYIAGYESFPVTYLKCVINSATFEQRQPVGCGATVADVDFTVNFTHPRGDLYIYEGTTLLAMIPHSVIGDETTSYTGVLKNQPVDNKDHELTVYFDDGTVKTDAPTTYTYNAKNIPEISVKSLSWGTVACDVPTVTLTAVINYTNQNGTLTADVDGKPANAVTYTVESDDTLQVTLVIPGIAADGLGGHLLNVNFDGSHGCAIVGHTIPEDAPITPAIDTLNVQFNPLVCTDLTATLNFDLDYTYQQGTLTYWVDGLTAQTASFTPQDKSKQTLTGLTFTDIPADGKSDHVLHVSFDGPNSCVKDFTLPAVPFSPVIDDVTITGVPATIACNAKDYTVAIAVTPHYTPVPAGKQIVITYDSLCTPKTTAPIDVTNFPYNLTLYNTYKGKKDTIYVAFADAPGCKTKVTYDAPARESCDCDSATICEGDSYSWRGKSYTGPVGVNKFVNLTDTLYLFVKEHPTISVGTIAMTCDNAGVVRIPFSAVKGQPDNFDVAIGSSHFAGSLDIIGTDTAFTFVPTALKAGDYAATVTVGETDVPCNTTENISFTIALSDHVYSKWTDVLFVSNKEGLFTTYQWFADGVAMMGETQQRLYDPTGLSGSTIVYHCRVTTTDGRTLYTCPQAFDDVTPSRTVDTTPAAVKSTTLYDAMGRVIKGTPHYGIYIVVEELEDGEIRTRKITVYE